MKKRVGNIIFLIVAITAVVVCVYYYGIRYYAEYMNHRDIVVPHNATVTNITEHTDSDSDDYYKFYVSYIYNETECENIYWKTEYSLKHNVGDIVEIRIDPDNPKYILNEATRGDVMIFVIIIAVAGLIYYWLDKFYNKRVDMSGEKKLITDKKVAFDLRPKFLTVAAMILICVAVGTVVLYFMLRELFSAAFLWWMAAAFIIGMIFQILAVYSISKMPDKKYSLNSLMCEKKWIDNDGDTTQYYVSFPGISKVDCNKLNYLQMCEGSYYYILQKQGGGVCAIYPISEWSLALEDRSLRNVYKTLIKKVWCNLILSVALETAFVFMFAVVTKLFIR